MFLNDIFKILNDKLISELERYTMNYKSMSEQRIEKLRSFILVTREMIENNNFQNIHIRKISEKVGLHNSTLYTYFTDADYLISLSSVKSLEPYSRALADLSLKNLSEYDIFFEIWYIFCVNAFKFPEIYNHFFFGKHSNDLTSIFNDYYSLFPNEQQKHSSNIHNMFFGKNLNIRCLEILKLLCGLDNVTVNNNNLELVNNLIISSFKSFLEQALNNKALDEVSKNDDLTKAFIETLHFIIDR